MPRLRETDWKDLRKVHGAAFTYLSDKQFDLLLKNMYAGVPQTNQIDETDALMMILARGEPPIQP